MPAKKKQLNKGPPAGNTYYGPDFPTLHIPWWVRMPDGTEKMGEASFMGDKIAWKHYVARISEHARVPVGSLVLRPEHEAVVPEELTKEHERMGFCFFVSHG